MKTIDVQLLVHNATTAKTKPSIAEYIRAFSCDIRFGTKYIPTK
jgi:hypothetical protein